MGIFKKLGWYFKAEKKRYILGISFLIGTSFINLMPPRILGIFVDRVNTKTITWSNFIWLLALLMFAAIALYLLRYGWRKEIWGGSAKLERIMRTQLFQHFLKMDETFFQRHRTGDLMAHATNDLGAIQNVAGGGILTLIDSVITGGTTIIAMMIFIDWRLTLVALIPMPLLAIVSGVLGKKLHGAFSESQAMFSKLNNKTQESVSGIKVIKTFGQEDSDAADFQGMVDETVNVNKKVFKLDSMFDPLISLIIGAVYVITIIYGGSMVMSKTISIGQLVSFISYISAMVWPMFAIGRLFNILERGSASYDRVMSILDEKSLVIDAEKTAIDIPNSNISYQVNHFNYPDEVDETVLENIDFDLNSGKTLGLVGKVGSGKSTIIKLLMREFDNYEGEITVGGINIKDLSLQEWLGKIGYVPQDNFLFSTTIRDNIRFGNINASKEMVIAAAQASAIHDDILHFSYGYDTLVGEKGVSLSGGQKQRLAIARAMLTDPDILILDDALSAVDAKTEEAILKSLKDARNDQTTIISAHRLSSVMHADEILVIENGHIKERGTHQELLDHKSWYEQMWEQQQLEVKIEGGVDNG